MSTPRLYAELATWWPLLSAPEEYAAEAAVIRDSVRDAADAPVRTLLELGAGGGNNAVHLKAWFELTLSDLSPEMLAVSRALNPECEHLVGDMRTLRLARAFDAVLVHDAIAYMTTEADLAAVFATAWEHLRPGGVAVFAPDVLAETWEPHTSHGGHDGDGRGLRYLEWTYDPDPGDTTFEAACVYLLREGDGLPVAESDHHQFGVFPGATWFRLLAAAGFEQAPLVADPRPTNDYGEVTELFVAVRPRSSA